jgi:hypothetical protein
MAGVRGGAGTDSRRVRVVARRGAAPSRGTCFATRDRWTLVTLEAVMIWMFAVIAVMGFALVKIRRQRKARQVGH